MSDQNKPDIANDIADKVNQVADIADVVAAADSKVGKNTGNWIRVASLLARLFGKK